MKKLLSIVFIGLSILTYAQTMPEMVLVKGGSFKMGNPYTDQLRKGNPDEKPVHTVSVSDFYIGKYEITIKQFKEFITDGSYKEFDKYGVIKRLPGVPDSTWWQGHPDCAKYWSFQVKKWWGLNDNYPMFRVTWYDAIAYCNWLSIKAGLEKCYYFDDNGIRCDITKNGYRLPTEAEWEFAARGGNNGHNYRYSGSNNYNDVAWIDENTFVTGPRVIGTKKANELGIYDMSGNVWEWCTDYYSPYYYAKSPSKNPLNSYPSSYRVIRGGSWHYSELLSTVYTRDGPKPSYTNYNYGFRVVRTK